MHATRTGTPQRLRADNQRGSTSKRGNGSAGLQPDVPGDRWGSVRASQPFAHGQLRASGQQNQDQGAVSGGRQRASRSGRADGSPFGSSGSSTGDSRPHFDAPVEQGGYRWWYVDGLSDDGQFGLTVIAFVGSVFSPYYAWSGRQNPENHVAINVALYDLRERSSLNRWAMTERTSRALRRDATSFTAGPSSLHWANSQHLDGDDLVIDVNEITVPIPRKLKGQIRFTPDCQQPTSFALDRGAHHHWWPYAPSGRISAQFSSPDLTWQGHGYSDTNTGTVALEKDFSSWTWSRAPTEDGAALLYEPREKDGFESTIAIICARDGGIKPFDPPPAADLPKGVWGITRQTRSETSAKLVRTLEDAPFYTRSVVETQLRGQPSMAIHESLNLGRFANPITKLMLPFRMPRRFW